METRSRKPAAPEASFRARPEREGGARPPADDANDSELVAGLKAGRAEGVARLMDRYDRLVRYELFRRWPGSARRDPQWLDDLSSRTWDSFFRAAISGNFDPTRPVAPFLLATARNAAISRLRAAGREPSLQVDSSDGETGAAFLETQATEDSPETLLNRIEHLERLRSCCLRLSADETRILTQLDRILDRRWVEASRQLGMAESTLRSQWEKIKQKLNRCLESKSLKER